MFAILPLVSLFAPKCPVSPKARTWIETSADWLCGQFGEAAMHGEVLLPTSVFPPGPYNGDEADLRRVLAIVCSRMGAPFDSIEVEIIEDDVDPDLGGVVPLASEFSGEAGHYRRDGDRFIVAVSRGQLGNPVSLTARLAHEVGHVRLLGEGRITTDRSDQEQLTDLVPVFFGLGGCASSGPSILRAAPRSRTGTTSGRPLPARSTLPLHLSCACWPTSSADPSRGWRTVPP
jgi:hypothetical protein